MYLMTLRLNTVLKQSHGYENLKLSKELCKKGRQKKTHQQQQKEESLQFVAKYWAKTINNAKTVHDILSIQQWLSTMEQIVQQAQLMENIVGPSNAHVNDKSNDSNDDDTTIDISSSHMFGI